MLTSFEIILPAHIYCLNNTLLFLRMFR